MTFSDLLQWWNLVFVIPFVCALGYLLLMMTGLVAAEGSADVDTDVHLDHDVDVGLDHALEAPIIEGEVVAADDLDHGIDHGHHSADMDTDDISGIGKALSFLGIGRVPLSILLMCFCFIWGLAGVTANQLFQSRWPQPELFMWPSLGATFLCSMVCTRLLALGLGKYMPASESYGVAEAQLIGKRATVRFKVTAASGTAQLYDHYGNLREVSCRVKSEEVSLPQGTHVVLMDYDVHKRVFLVRVDPLEKLKNHGLDSDPARGILP